MSTSSESLPDVIARYQRQGKQADLNYLLAQLSQNPPAGFRYVRTTYPDGRVEDAMEYVGNPTAQIVVQPAKKSFWREFYEGMIDPNNL